WSRAARSKISSICRIALRRHPARLPALATTLGAPTATAAMPAGAMVAAVPAVAAALALLPWVGPAVLHRYRHRVRPAARRTAAAPAARRRRRRRTRWAA